MSSAEKANIVIIGGGVVGTAIADELSHFHEDVFLLEANPRLGMATSTRNSGVIHAGIYYKPDSLKAFHCVRGARMLYEFCAQHDIPCRRTGKLIVADEEAALPQLQSLKERGERNGVEDLEIVDRHFIQRLEPNIVSPIALYSPNTGIVEPEALIKTLARRAQSNGAHILPGTRVLGAQINNCSIKLRTQREEVEANVVINSAGLFSDEIARMLGYDKYTIYPCRGEYAEITPGRSRIVNGLVYPLPPPSGHGLGVHFTRTTAGALLLGPNARYVKNKDDYENDREGLNAFFESASKMVRGLKLDDLRPGYTGLRPRLAPEHENSFADFVIERDPNSSSIIHLIGIESPGLTSSLSIAKGVAEMLSQ